MSRTYRSLDFNYGYFRDIRTIPTKRMEHYAAQQLREEGFHPHNRLQARAHMNGKTIPTAWEDINVSARAEMDYNGGILLRA
jgi:hypothetical protein